MRVLQIRTDYGSMRLYVGGWDKIPYSVITDISGVVPRTITNGVIRR